MSAYTPNSGLPISRFSGSDFVELLQWRAEHQPDTLIFTELLDGEDQTAERTCAELDRRARAVAARLAEATRPGDRALLLYAGGMEFVEAFFGCLYAGVVAVPSYPPDPARLQRTLPRLRSIVRDAQPRIVLTTNGILGLAERFTASAPEVARLPWMATDAVSDADAEDWRRPEIESETLALLQYTSGSTAEPKGVMVTHGNLLANEAMIMHAFGHSQESVGASWLPVFHDMGLMGHILQPIYLGAHNVLMSPLAFLQRPARWLRAISKYRATTSGAPNFAYEFCTRKVKPEQIEGIDLSSWRVAYNGAEPIAAETLERFTEAFAPHGFRPSSVYPCYGMAEATLIISGGDPDAGVEVQRVDASALRRHRVEPPRRNHRRIVGCGNALPGEAITVVDPRRRTRCAPGRVGEIWVAGAHVAAGYWNRDQESGRTFGARLADGDPRSYLRTGDLGYLDGDELYVTGRIKDAIVIRGRNHYPQDIEHTVSGCDPVLRPGGAAAFSFQEGGEGRVVVVQEVRRERNGVNLDQVLGSICEAVTATHQIQLHAAVLIEPGSIPKTSSGKIRRRACRDLFRAEELPEVRRWQRARDLRATAVAAGA